MKTILTFAALLIAQSAALSSDEDAHARARAAMDLAPVPPVEPKALTYTEALIQCKQQQKPLVVFIGIPSRPIEGAISAQETSMMRTFTGKLVERGVMITADGATGYWYVPEATDLQIKDAIRLAVRQAPVPFSPTVRPDLPDEDSASSRNKAIPRLVPALRLPR